METPGAGDEDPVRQFLVEKLGAGVESVSFLARGAWSLCFCFRLAGSDNVVRFGRHLEDFDKDRIASAYASVRLPVPGVIEVGLVDGGFYAISERIFGEPLDGLDARGWRAVLPAIFSTLDAARETDISGTSGFGLWGGDGRGSHRTWREYLTSAGEDARGRRIDGWRDRLKESPIGESAFDESLSILEAIVGCCPEVRQLVHCDLHLNLFVTGNEVTGLLDWGCSIYGDSLYDHAFLAYWAPWYPATSQVDLIGESAKHLESVGADMENFEQRMLCYEIHVGLEAQAYNAFIRHWDELAATAERTLAIARASRF